MAIDDASQGQTLAEALNAAIDGESKCQICHFVEQQNCGSDDISLVDTLSKLLILSPNLANFSFPRQTSGPPLSTGQIALGLGQILSRHRPLSKRANAKLPGYLI